MLFKNKQQVYNQDSKFLEKSFINKYCALLSIISLWNKLISYKLFNSQIRPRLVSEGTIYTDLSTSSTPFDSMKGKHAQKEAETNGNRIEWQINATILDDWYNHKGYIKRQ